MELQLQHQSFQFLGRTFFLISFSIDWLNLLAVQGTLKSLLQHHNLKASVLWCSGFSIVQLLYPYMTTGKTIALTRQTFVDKVMSLLFNMLSRFVIVLLPRSKWLFISWLQSPSAVILEHKKMKSDTVSTFSLSICHEVIGLDATIFIFCMLNFKPAFSLSSFTFIKRLFSSSSLSAIQAWRSKGSLHETCPGLTMAGFTELSVFWLQAGADKGWKERDSKVITFHALTLPTSEHGPISVLPLTNQRHTFFLGEH